jgi:hypothetical protein
MTIFDLLFLGLAFVSVVTLLAAAVLAVSGNREGAGRILKTWGIGFAAYMGVVVVSSAVLPRRIAQVGEALCNDDWCLTVERADYQAGSYRVSFRISSRALRVTQREHGVSVYLTDAAGRRYNARPDSAEIPFDVPIGPGQEMETVRAFDVPNGVMPVGLVIRQGSGFPIGWFIIGYDTWFRKPTLVRLERVGPSAP